MSKENLQHKDIEQEENNIHTEKEDKNDINVEEEEKEEKAEDQEAQNEEINPEIETEEEDVVEIKVSEIARIEGELGETKDKYLRLYSEFENFRRRTSKEKLDLIKTANEDLMIALLPIIDDFERADKSFSEKEDKEGLFEGYKLIHNKLQKILEQKGLKAMEIEKGDEFDSEVHEAISQYPVEEKDLKGKIIDVIEKGYYLGDKVIRFAKVVIGA